MKPLLTANLLVLAISVSYHFGNNFGQVFKDLSNNGLHGVNGDSESSEASDIRPTDRGAYFSGSTYIKYPPNSKVASQSISLSSPFTFALWAFSDTAEGVILHHQKDLSNYFLVVRSASKKLSYRFLSASYDSSLISTLSNSLVEDVWKLLFISYSHPDVKVYINKDLSSSLTMTSSYSESGTFDTYLGKSAQTYSGYKGFIYYAELSNTLMTYIQFIGSASSTCLVEGCSNCNELIKDIYLNKEGCLSNEKNPDKNSNKQGCGSICTSAGVSCSPINKNCMTCSCSTGSCTLISDVPKCLCPTSSTATTTTCTCSGKYYYQFDECLPCLSQCLTCTSSSTCSSCVATYASLSGSSLCSCISEYYIDNVNMDTTDACKPCHVECSSCTQANICSFCKASNASPSGTSGCVCNAKFYGSNLISLGSCLACHPDCQTCNQANKCLTCINTSKVPSLIAGCACDEFYYFDTVSGNCAQCFTKCATCSDSVACITCKDPNAETSSCICKSGYGLNPDNQCWICSVECTSCDANYKCQSCVDTNSIANSKYTCDCISKYYKSGTTCSPCNSSCKTCSSALTCDLCTDPAAKVINGICACSAGFYSTSGPNDEPICSKCAETCGTCSNPSQCSTCWDINAEKNSTGLCSCKSSFFYDVGSVSCVPCNQTCLTCSGPSQFECLTCKFVKFLNSCLDECPANYVLLDDLCIPVEGNDTIMEFKFLDVGTFYRDFVHGYKAEQLALVGPTNTDGVVNVYQRGVFFNGSNMLKVNITGIMLIGSSFCVTVWVKVQSQKAFIFYKPSLIKYYLFNKKISADVLISDKLEMVNSPEQESEKWMHLYLSIGFSQNTQATLMKDKQVLLQEIVSNMYFVDDYSDFVYLGGNKDENNTLTGFMYDFKLYSKVIPIKSLVTECVGCSLCTSEGLCLPDCDISEYSLGDNSSCQKCPSECPKLCKSSKECHLCDDANCLNCQNYHPNSCISCRVGYELKNGTCSKCQKPRFYNQDNKTCDLCPKLCLSCSSLTKCLSCKENSELVNNICACSAGYELLGNCSRRYFSAKLKVNSQNLANLTFNESLKESLASQMISIKIEGKSTKFKLKEISLLEYQIKPEVSMVKNNSKLTLQFLEILESSNNSLLETKKLSGRMTKTQEMIEQEELEEKAKSSKNYSKLISIIIASILCFLAWTYSDPFAMFEFFNSLEMIYAVYLFDLELNPVLSEFLVGMKVIEYIPSPFTLLKHSKLGQPTNEKLEKYGYERNLVILNLGLHFTLFFGLLTIIAFISMVSQRFRSRFAKSLKFGFFLRFWVQANFEMMIASTFGLQFSEKNGSLELFDYALCVCIIIVHLLTSLFLFHLIAKRNKFTSETQIQEFVSKYSTFFDDFKDSGIGNRLFYFLFICRRLILVIVIHFIKLYAFQLAVHLIMCLAISIYVGITRCFKTNTHNLFHIINELIIASYICVVFASQVENSLMESLSGSYTCIYIIFAQWSFACITGLYNTNANLMNNLKNCIEKIKSKRTSLKYRGQTSPDIETNANKIG